MYIQCIQIWYIQMFNLLVMFVGLYRSLQKSTATRETEPLRRVGLRELGIVETVVGPGILGRIYYQGTWWSALSDGSDSFLPGDRVLVIGRQNITLIVTSCAEG